MPRPALILRSPRTFSLWTSSLWTSSLWIALALACLPWQVPSALAEPPAKVAEPLATIEGTVSYQADPARRWRYGRYYIKNARSGELAEAVVALTARGLGRTEATEEESRPTVIDQKNFQFVPETVAIRAGDRVTFTNSDNAAHNVRASDAIASFNVNMPPQGEHTVRFEEGGGIRRPVQVGCVFHGSMRAWIFVFDHPYYQLTGPDGRFQLSGVPPGTYLLEMVHPAGQLQWRQRVEVQAGQTLKIDIRVSPDDKQS